MATFTKVVEQAKPRFTKVVEDIQQTDTGGKLAHFAQVFEDKAVELGGDIKEGAAELGGNIKEGAAELGGAIADFWSNLELPDAAETDARAAVAVGGYLAPFLPVNAAKFAEFMSDGGNVSLDETDLSTEDVQFLRDKALGVLADGRSGFSYEKDWGVESHTLLVDGLAGTAGKSLSDPAFRMATLIGQTADGNVFIENGRLKVKDTYDFNTGPLAKKLQQALLLKEAGDLEGYKVARDNAFTGADGERLPYFARLRVWAAALGAPEGSGTEWVMDLGEAEE